MEDGNDAETPRAKCQKMECAPEVALPNEVIFRPLMRAFLNKDLGAAEKFLRDRSLNLNVRLSRWTPLIFAIRTGNFDFVKLLVSYGANVNWDDAPYDPFHYACRRDNMEVVQFLLEKGADVNKKSKFDEIALFTAVELSNLKLVSILLNYGATIDSRCSYYGSLLCSANRLFLMRGTTSVLALLLRHGVPLNYDGVSGSSCHYAVERCDKDCVVLLMECGAKQSSVKWSEINLNHNPDFYAWCKWYMSQPLSLKCLSGQFVRQHLVETHKKSVLPFVTQLGLPVTLVEYLAFDRFSYMEQAPEAN